jgi:RNA polymerase-binding transcription factor DksA
MRARGVDEPLKAIARRQLLDERRLLLARYASADTLDGYERARLLRISAALERLDEDTWGWCRECGHAIELSRLSAAPDSARCAHCAR